VIEMTRWALLKLIATTVVISAAASREAHGFLQSQDEENVPSQQAEPVAPSGQEGSSTKDGEKSDSDSDSKGEAEKKDAKDPQDEKDSKDSKEASKKDPKDEAGKDGTTDPKSEKDMPPPPKEYHPSGLPKPPTHLFQPPEEAKKTTATRYPSGLPRPPSFLSPNDPQDLPAALAPGTDASTAPRREPAPNAAPADAPPGRLMPPPIAEAQATDQPREKRPELQELSPNLRVKVNLRNGQTFEGLVRDERFVQDFRRGKLHFGGAARITDGGFRLWYVYSTQGYIHIPYTQVASVKVIRTLDDVELNALQDGVRKSRDRALQSEADRLAERDRRREAEKTRSAKTGEASTLTKDDPEVVAHFESILAEFPPQAGWSPEKKEELYRRMIVSDIYPDEKEQAFLDKFDDWLPAYQWWSLKSQQTEKAQSADNSDAPPDKTEVPSDKTETSEKADVPSDNH